MQMYFTKVILSKQPVLIKINENAKFSTKSLEAIKMSYRVYESGKPSSITAPSPVIMMHGLLGSKSNWRSVCRSLLRNTVPQRKVVAVDVRNHGDSPHSNDHTYGHLAQDLKALLAELQINKAALLGHSMGGRAMMYFALTNSNLVDKLIVGDISPITASTTFKSMPSLFDVMQNVALPKNLPKADAKRAVEEQILPVLNDPGLCTFLLTNLAQNKDGSYKWQVNIPVLVASFHEHLVNFPNVTGLEFTGPTLFVTGEKSDFVPDSDHAEILKLFPNAEFKKISGAGHWLYTDKPDEFNRICVEFLNKKS